MRSMTETTKTGALQTRKKASTSRPSPTNMVSSNGPNSGSNRSTQIGRGTISMLSRIGLNESGRRVVAGSKIMPGSRDKTDARIRRGRLRTTKDSGTTSKHETRRSSTAYSRLHESNIARNAGSLTTVTGANAVATTDTASPTIAFVDTSGRNTRSESTDYRSWCTEAIHDFSTGDIGSLPLTRGRNTGATNGMTTTTCM